jgi:hypothetical protein
MAPGLSCSAVDSIVSALRLRDDRALCAVVVRALLRSFHEDISRTQAKDA